MMRNGVKNEPVDVSYAAGVVLSDENADDNMRAHNAKRKMVVV